MIHRNRKQGTGCIRRNGGRWEARTPQRGDARGKLLGRFDMRREAERALDAWLANNQPEARA